LTAFFQHIIDLDTSISLGVNAWHSQFWDVFMPLYSSKYVWVCFYLSILYVVARNYSWRWAVLWLLAGVAVITICDQVTASLIRPWVARLRPSNLENPVSDVVHVVNGYRGGSYSFPSAHAANSWGLAIFITLLFRKRLLSWAIIIWAIATCYSRLYLGVHYFGDLVTGTLIGCLSASFVYFLIMRVTKLKKPEEVIHDWVPVVVLALTVLTFLGIATVKCI